ncbi:cilia- and flagella-associated protein 276 [Genypterus blacodes]|uniref:cilia- and flagella-associated protein 276 n=1 Tax=Genypterus blacodes TaxID=154954 RepID=UPI003F76AABB
MSKRDPYGSPKLENDFTLSGFKPEPKKQFDKPTYIAHTEEPWSHLHNAATLSSTQRTVHEQQVQKDSLDLHLKAVYDHHTDLLRGKNQIVYQKETFEEQHSRQENAEREIQDKEKDNDIAVWVDPQRRSIHSIYK